MSLEDAGVRSEAKLISQQRGTNFQKDSRHGVYVSHSERCFAINTEAAAIKRKSHVQILDGRPKGAEA